LEKKTHIKIIVDVSLGLDCLISFVGSIITCLEVVMINSFANATDFAAHIWVGIALLRRLVENPT